MLNAIEKLVFQLQLRDEWDVPVARRRARELAETHGLPLSAAEALVTAVSEVARNAVVHAGGGELLLGTRERDGRMAIVAIARDTGPGISNVEDAMRDGYSTGTGLGLGLPSARRLVDEFELRSTIGEGTTVCLQKWAPSQAAP